MPARLSPAARLLICSNGPVVSPSELTLAASPAALACSSTMATIAAMPCGELDGDSQRIQVWMPAASWVEVRGVGMAFFRVQLIGTGVPLKHPIVYGNSLV